MKIKLLALSILSGLLLFSGWSTSILGLLMHVALVPLFFIEEFFFTRKREYKSVMVFLFSFVAFFIWILADIWWVYRVSLPAMLVLVVLESLLPATVFWLFHAAKRKIDSHFAYPAFFFFWLAYEYANSFSDFAFPWINLGNGLVNNVSLIQFYEYTGQIGGTAWLLFNNILVYKVLSFLIKHKTVKGAVGNIILLLISLLSLSFFSFYLYGLPEKTNGTREIVLLQTNTNPYNRQLDSISAKAELDVILNLADSAASAGTQYFIAPETAISENLWEYSIENYFQIKKINAFLKKYPQASFVIGSYTAQLYAPEDKKPDFAIPYSGGNFAVGNFNTAIMLDQSVWVQLYRKSKLVLGTENRPFRFIPNVRNDGQTMPAGLGTQARRANFRSELDSIKIAPVICWESVFSDFIADYIRGGAQLIVVLTNDAWWNGTAGNRQHLQMSRIRAIETRRYVARAANGGISALISSKGDVLFQTKTEKATALRVQAGIMQQKTFYVKHGNYLGRMASFISLLFALFLFVRSFIR